MGRRLLVIDTATAACSVALFEENELIANDYAEIGRGHAEKLVPMIADLPRKGRADQILVNCGPGSFTGTRIGISVAKALSLAWNAKLGGYQCLQLLAVQELSIIDNKKPIYVCMQAGHGEFFVQNYSDAGIAIDDLESLALNAAMEKKLSDTIIGTGNAILPETKDSDIHSIVALPDAVSAILLDGMQMVSNVAPIYVREPDAVKTATS
ncbi:MAG: tRNA (adenosine(37)-N6)-threonylcarbamoyltransferase complex dimerization subunit type 1 TsaB [Parasphingorhabdus sp.]